MDIDFEHIEQYLEGALGPEEKRAFEEYLQRDPQLQERVALHRLANQAGKLLIEDEIRERLDHIRSQEPRRLQRFRFSPLAIAASVLLFGAIGVLGVAQLNYSGPALAEAYRMAPLTTLQADRSAADPFEAAQGLILSGQTGPEAIDLLSALEANDPNYLKAQYLLAHSYLHEKEYEKALLRFEVLLANSADASGWVELHELDWNLAICLLGAGREDQARKALDEIAHKPGHPQAGRAEELLEDLDSPWHALTWR